ncbi:MAG TPA: 2-C-methyl-D-erythritol 4-phosphate cytidylyltransferase [Jiangellaceae bacterium]
MTTACILVAAGRGERLGPGTPKALRQLAGQPLVVRAARAALESGALDVLVVAAPGDLVTEVESELRPLDGPVVIVAGGTTRRESVAAALTTLSAEVDVVLVHDAARCLAPAELFNTVAAAVSAGADAVIPALAIPDTVKQVDDDVVVATLDRSVLRAVQTPQGFRRDVLVRAHAAEAADATDDAGLVERLGRPVRVVPGHEDAFKITRPVDLVLAEAVLARRSGPR